MGQVRVVSREALDPNIWKDFCRGASGTTLWHELDWVAHWCKAPRPATAQDHSFLVVDDAGPIAATPAVLSEVDGGNGSERLLLVQAPALRPRQPSSMTADHMGAALDAAVRLTRESGAARCSVNLHPLAADGQRLLPILLTATALRSFVDASGLTHVVDVSQPGEHMWRRLSENHRRNIRRAATTFEVSVGRERFDQYADMHSRMAGAFAPTEAMYAEMNELLSRDRAVLLAARDGRKAVAFVLAVIWGRNAYFHKGVSEENLRPRAAAHMLQWEAMRLLGTKGVQWYELGKQYPAVHSYEPNEKLQGIARFKRGFGGVNRAVVRRVAYVDPEPSDG